MSLMLAGTNSKLAEYSMTKTKKDKLSFIKQSTSCGYYSYSIRSHAPLHHKLSYEFTKLPAIHIEMLVI
ncbi:hypothetical protein cypCar_00015900 [Cyprinus carpio]|nr:hypothetical protein cypCar_00015900 [Cyprinus carpio]